MSKYEGIKIISTNKVKNTQDGSRWYFLITFLLGVVILVVLFSIKAIGKDWSKNATGSVKEAIVYDLDEKPDDNRLGRIPFVDFIKDYFGENK